MQSAMAAQLSEYSTTTTSLESIITGELSCNSQSFAKIYKYVTVWTIENQTIIDLLSFLSKMTYQFTVDFLHFIMHIIISAFTVLLYTYAASDHLFNDASRLVTRSAAASSKLQDLEQKLLIDNEESKQQCLQVNS